MGHSLVGDFTPSLVDRSLFLDPNLVHLGVRDASRVQSTVIGILYLSFMSFCMSLVT